MRACDFLQRASRLLFVFASLPDLQVALIGCQRRLIVAIERAHQADALQGAGAARQVVDGLFSFEAARWIEARG